MEKLMKLVHFGGENLKFPIVSISSVKNQQKNLKKMGIHKNRV